MSNKQTVKIGNITVERVVKTNKNGDRIIRHLGDDYRLYYHRNEVETRLTSNFVQGLQEKISYVDRLMHHPEHPQYTQGMLEMMVRNMEEFMKKYEAHLIFWYEVEQYEYDSWIQYAKKTLAENRNKAC